MVISHFVQRCLIYRVMVKCKVIYGLVLQKVIKINGNIRLQFKRIKICL